MFDSILKPKWMKESHFEIEEIKKAYMQACQAKFDYDFRSEESPNTGYLLRMYILSICKLYRLIENHDRSRHGR